MNATESIQQNHEQHGFRERLEGVVEGYQDWAERYPFAATTAETAALFVAKKAVQTVGQKIGLNLGNGHEPAQLEMAAKHPLLAVTKTIVASPVVEELVFRKYLTPALKEKTGHEDGLADHASTLLFALGHLGNLATKRGRESLAAPISPLMGGENYQRLANSRGLSHAIGGHILNNALEVATVAPKVIKMRTQK